MPTDALTHQCRQALSLQASQSGPWPLAASAPGPTLFPAFCPTLALGQRHVYELCAEEAACRELVLMQLLRNGLETFYLKDAPGSAAVAEAGWRVPSLVRG